MPKAKKSDLEKTTKTKSVKPAKAEKPAKEKKVKAVIAVEPASKPVAKPAKAPKKAVVAKAVKAPKPAPIEIVLTVEEISLRAYYIAERRQAMGWPGDSAHDWIEAERQLKAEAKRKAKS
jgi:hypothetical protein